MKRSDQIRKVCADWHGGSWSALYQFASSGKFMPENILRYLKELQGCRESEYFLHPRKISIRNDKQLAACQRWFENQYDGRIIWMKHPDYGYKIPYLENDDKIVKGLILAI